MKWKVLESTYLHKIPWLTIRKDVCEMPNGNIIPAFYVNEYPDWVNAFGLTKEGKVIMVQQYRHGIGTIETELPGGVVEENESLEDGVLRETLEETGYAFDKVEYLGKISANPSTTNNFMHMFLATGGEKVVEQDLDHSEEIDVVLMTIDEVKQLVRENKIMQSLHVNCIMYALMKLGEAQF
jgi:ADP-ribose pyrophosphatase